MHDPDEPQLMVEPIRPRVGMGVLSATSLFRHHRVARLLMVRAVHAERRQARQWAWERARRRLLHRTHRSR